MEDKRKEIIEKAETAILKIVEDMEKSPNQALDQAELRHRSLNTLLDVVNRLEVAEK